MSHRILAIDDDFKFTNVLRANLERLDEFTVQVVNDPRSAIDEARRYRPEVILLDLMMPGMDGCDVLIQLQQDVQLQHIPVILLTGLLTDEKGLPRHDPQEEEMSFLSKPVDMDVLTRTLREAIRRPAAPRSNLTV